MDPADLAALTEPATQAWLAAHADADPTAVAMGRGIGADLPRRAIAEQLRCRAKARAKLPDWIAAGCLFDARALEQCSSQATARAKAGLLHGRVIDASAGLGVDAWAAAEAGSQVVACERDPGLAALLAFNAERLGVALRVHHGDGMAFIAEQAPEACDVIYVDPDRRRAGSRVLDLAAASPALPQHLAVLSACSRHLVVKLAPGADPAIVSRQLPHARRLEWRSWRGECRELIACCDAAAAPATPVARALGVDDGGACAWSLSGPPPASVPIAPVPGAWWIEPDPAIIRAGLVGTLARDHGLGLLHPRVAYATADGPRPPVLPGRVYRVRAAGPYHPKTTRRDLRDLGVSQAAIGRRHFPREPAAIAKELRIADRGTTRLACYRDADESLRWVLAEPCTRP